MDGISSSKSKFRNPVAVFARTTLIIAAVIIPLAVLAQVADPAFNANKIIEDKVFLDTQTFGGAAGVQKFLETKKSPLANTGSDFLIKLKEPSSSTLKQSLEDPQPNLGRLRTAAELIWDASVQSGLNPQILLVTLNKEQGLITSASNYSSGKLQTALDHALGFDCPDGQGCGNLFPGFYYQLFGNFDSAGNRYLGAAKSLAKSFGAANGRGPIINGRISHVGDSITLDNTQGGFDNIPAQQTVTLQNRATAALYRYTPHVFNGNYNFWRYFQAWFKYPNGTLIKLLSAKDVYIIQNGLKQLVPLFVSRARNLDLSGAIVLSPTEYDSFQTDVVLGPADNTIVIADDGKKYVFISNIKHPASDFVIKQRRLDTSKTMLASVPEAALFSDGSVLTPSDGTIIRGKTNPAIYLVQSGNLQLFSGFTFAQRKIPKAKVVALTDDEISSYPKQGFVPPLDNTVIKSVSDPAVYLFQNGLKQPITAEIFKNRGLSYKAVAVLSQDELNALPTGNYASPKDKSYFTTSDTNQNYLYKEGSKHPISAFVAKQRGIKPGFKVDSSIASAWLDGIPLPPKDGTLIKSDVDGTIYLVKNGQLDPLTAAAFKNRKYSVKKIVSLPQDEIDAYAKGDTLEK